MKKGIKFIVCLALVLTVTNVSATCTSLISGPKLTPGVTNYGTSYSLASDYATAKGSNAKTFFYNLGALTTNYASWTGRVITYKLMDVDVLNADDLIKTYTGSFIGRTLDSITLTTTHISGYIESEGDHISELYLTAYMTKHADDPAAAANSTYDYQLCQD